MGWFKRTPDEEPLDPELFSRIGRAAYGGDSPYPPGSGAVSAETTAFVLDALARAGHPAPGGPKWDAYQDRLLQAIFETSRRGDGWCAVGAMCILWDAVAGAWTSDPRYEEIVLAACDLLRLDGVAFTAIPPYAIERWTSEYGRSGITPSGWPSALHEVPVPASGAAPPVTDLQLGESRHLADTDQGTHVNRIYGERREERLVVAVIDGVDEGVRKRWDWLFLTAPDYPAFLRELGERLTTPQLWAHDELAPYFPCRPKTREEMRREAGDDPFAR